MQNMSASDWVMLIGAMAGGIVLVINAFGTYWGRKEVQQVRQEQTDLAATADKKLDVIHDLTNSAMSKLKEQLATALTRIDTLEKMLDRTNQKAS